MPIWIALFVLISLIAIAIALFLFAPVGYEDEEGFHFGEKK